MRSDVGIALLSLLLLIQEGLFVEISNEEPKKDENQVEGADAGLFVAKQGRLQVPIEVAREQIYKKNANTLHRGKKIKPPTYNVPKDVIFRDAKIWAYVDSPQNRIPIPRAPTPTFGQVVPKPQVWHKYDAFYKISPTFLISINGPSNYILEKAVSRYERLTNDCSRLSVFSRFSVPRSISDMEIDKNLHMASRKNLKSVSSKQNIHRYGPAAKQFASFAPCPNQKSHSSAIECLQISVNSLGNFWPSAEMNESYYLMVDPGGVKIMAQEVWGAIRALETFSQLLWCSPTGSSIFINQTFIHDYPTFSHRGLHVDTARHFISKRNILINLEAMAFNKFNVFHWHFVDDQSFPFASKTFPELYLKAAYHPKMIYTHEDIKEIIEFARVRGIRVIPEFDIPGHTRSWAYSHPELFVKCYEGDKESPYYGGLDPTKEETLDFLVKFFREIIELFPESYLHMGFDEVEFSCLDTNPHIKNYLYEHQLQTSIDAIKLFTVKLLNGIQTSAKKSSMTGGKKFIFWQEALESNLKLPNNSVIHQWKDISSIPGYFGFPTIVSKGWYLDSYFKPSEWVKYYENDLFRTIDLANIFNKSNDKSVIGGEACMWNEWQSDETVIQRIWPVVCAIAERLWNYESPDTDEFAPRLEEMRCRLLRRGIQVGVTGGPGMCPFPPNADINPPRISQIDYNTHNSPPVISQKIHDIDSSTTNLLIFLGIVLFTLGYIASRLSLCSCFQRILKRSYIGLLNFRISKLLPSHYRRASGLILPVCFLVFMGLLLLFSANVSRSGSKTKPVD